MRLWTLFGIVAFGTMILWIAYFNCLDYARGSVQTITKDSIPSVVAAQQLRQGFFEMDGHTVANYLELTHGGKALYDIDKDRLSIAKQLVVAAQNITYGDAEADPIRRMVGRLPMYSELTSPALEGQGNWRARRLLMASDLLHSELVESANQLDKVNRDHLVAAYNESLGALVLRSMTEWVLGLVFIGLLICIQLVIARESHRMINVPLAIATILAIVIVFANAPVMGSEAKTLKIAKEDAFDSVGFLSEAQADGADARAQALYGLIPEGKAKCWALCKGELGALAAANPDELDRSYSASQEPTFKGLLGNELRNITFEGEAEAANAELHRFATFDRAVVSLESAENTEGVEEAVKAAFAPETSIDSTYEQYDEAVKVTKQINQSHFESARDRAFAMLNLPSLTLNLGALAVIVLAYFGVRQRVAEYAD